MTAGGTDGRGPKADGWDPKADWVLPAMLRQRAAQHGDRPFLRVEDGAPETFAQILSAAEDVAAKLARLGVRAGDLVPLLAQTSAACVHAWLGINLAGAADVPLNTAYRGMTLIHGISLCGARLLVADPEFVPRIAEVAAQLGTLQVVVTLGRCDTPVPGLTVVSLDDVDLAHPAVATAPGPADPAPAGPRPGPAAPGPAADGAARGGGPTYRDIASVLYTSGTTGPAKGVLMTHAQTYVIAREIVDGLRLTERDTFYCFHPLFHMTRFGSVYAALLAGCAVTLDRRFDPAAWLDRVRQYGATATIGHGPMLEAMYAQPPRPDDADSPLRVILTAPLPARIAADFERRFGVRAIDTWGMTEVTCVTMRPYDAPLRPGCCGKPRDDLLEVVITDADTDEELPAGQVGEITVRPRQPWIVMQGYLGMPERTLEAWRNFRFHSGDYGYLTPDGYLYFAERSGDRIRRRAENVSAYDIEQAAAADPRVRECAAVGVASQFESDDDIKLCLVVTPGPPADLPRLLARLAAALPAYMVPRYLEVLPELPRTPTNKIQRQLLRESGVAGAWDRVAAGISVRALASRPDSPPREAS